jgi:hypothetical protein
LTKTTLVGYYKIMKTGKATKKPKKCEYVAVCLPRETKRKVRTIAAEMETSLGRAALRLIELGLEEYIAHGTPRTGAL